METDTVISWSITNNPGRERKMSITMASVGRGDRHLGRL
jgi:hypothetical protein